MGISLEAMAYAGCWEARISELASYNDHAALFAHVEELIRETRIAALLVDAREAEIPQKLSLSREVWDNALSVLHVIPLGYLPPPDDSSERRAMIHSLIAEWEADITFFRDREAALDWCRRQAWPTQN